MHYRYLPKPFFPLTNICIASGSSEIDQNFELEKEYQLLHISQGYFVIAPCVKVTGFILCILPSANRKYACPVFKHTPNIVIRKHVKT